MLKKMGSLCKTIFLVLCLSLLLDGRGSIVRAAPGLPDGLAELEGSTEYMDESRYSYSLDIEETGLLDILYKAVNMLADMFFGLVEILGKVTVSVYYYCTQCNLGDLFVDQIDIIHKGLYAVAFKNMLWLGLAAVGIKMVSRIWRKNLTAAAGDVMALVLVMAAAFLISDNAALLLDDIQGVTNEISKEIMVNISQLGSEDADVSSADYTAMAAGSLWKNMVLTPWKHLEFGTTEVDEDVMLDILGTTDLKERQEKVNELVEDEAYSKAFSKGNGVKRIGLAIFYFLIALAKAVIFMLCSVLQFVYQIITVIFFFLAPIVLILSLFPGFGFKIIEAWLKKLLALQISAIVMSAFMAVLILLDNWIMGMFSGSVGSLTGCAIEAIMLLCIFLFHKRIFSMFETVHRSVQMPRQAITGMRNSGSNPYRTGSMIGGAVKYGIYRKVMKKLGPAGAAAGKAAEKAAEKQTGSSQKQSNSKRPRSDDHKDAAKKDERRTAAGSGKRERQERQTEQFEQKRRSIPRPTVQEQLEKGQNSYATVQNHSTMVDIVSFMDGFEKGRAGTDTSRPITAVSEQAAAHGQNEIIQAQEAKRQVVKPERETSKKAETRSRALAQGTLVTVQAKEKGKVDRPELSSRKEGADE